MKYNAIVKKINPIIEEEVVIEINNIELVVFVNVCEYIIQEKKTYPVIIDFDVLDDLDIVKISESKRELIRLNKSFEYEIKGLLRDDGILDVGILIDSEWLKEYQYLYGEFVKIKVDRINAEFIS